MTTPGPTVVNDIADLYRILDEQPQWKEALRYQLLGPELLAGPERLDELTAGIRELRETVSQLAETAAENTRQCVELRETAAEHTRQLAELREIAAEHTRQIAELREIAAEHTRQLAELTVQVHELRETAADHTRQFVELRETAAENTRQIVELRRITANQTTRMNRMENDMSEVKGMLAEFRTERTCSLIADASKLAGPEPIPTEEMIRFANRLDLESSTRDSFIRADLVFLAQDQEDAPHYAAIEISWTVGQWDIDRARRNAALIEQATGIPALAVAAGNRYEEQLDWSEVAWVQLTA